MSVLARLAAGLLLTGALVGGGAYAWIAGVRHDAPPAPSIAFSPEVQDRDGLLLRPFPLADGRWRLKAEPARVDRRFTRDAGRL